MAIIETRRHGTEDFPFALYNTDCNHPRYEMVLHYHSNIEIIRVQEGSLHLTLDNKSFDAVKGDIFFVNSQTLHGAIPKSCKYQCLVFNLEFFKNKNSFCNAFIDDLISRNVEVFDKLSFDGADDLIEKIFDAMDKKAEGYQFFVTAGISELLGNIKLRGLYTQKLSNYTDNDSKRVKLKRVIDFIRKNFDKELTLCDMASSCDFSPKYFCSFFKKSTGKTPFSYLNEYRIEKACSMILSSDATITQIAFSCGFNDLSYFIKTFKKSKGVSPNIYRSKIYN